MATPKKAKADSPLRKFEGSTVLSAGIEVKNAGGGLNEALAVDPQEWHRGDEVVVVLKCKVEKLRFDPVPKTDGLRRVHIMSASQATVVDESLVAGVLEEQAVRIERAKGIIRLPFGEDLQEEHDRGEHRDLVEGCPACDAEAVAQANGD